MYRESNPGDGKIFRTRPDTASCTMGTGFFFWGEIGRSLALTIHLI
jgi:hypothetical protein